MGIFKEIIEWMREINETDFGQLCSFIGMLTGIVALTRSSFLFVRKHSRSIAGVGFVVIILLLGLILPILTLLSTNWSGWKHILLNILAIYGLFSFAVLLYIIKAMRVVKMNKHSQAIIGK